MVVQRAEQGRTLEAPVAAAAPASGPEPDKPVAPDLDLLARQVYAALKRRLDAERRRQLP
jgi:hypothetical protein